MLSGSVGRVIWRSIGVEQQGEAGSVRVERIELVRIPLNTAIATKETMCGERTLVSRFFF